MTRNGYHVTVLLLSILMRSSGEGETGHRGARAELSVSSGGFMDMGMHSTAAIACLTPSPGDGAASTFHSSGPSHFTVSCHHGIRV